MPVIQPGIHPLIVETVRMNVHWYDVSYLGQNNRPFYSPSASRSFAVVRFMQVEPFHMRSCDTQEIE